MHGQFTGYASGATRPTPPHPPSSQAHAPRLRSDADREFVGMLAHELRNALNALHLLLHDAEHPAGRPSPSPSAPAQPAGVPDALRRPVDRMARLVADLMELCTSSHSTFRLANAQADLRGIVRRAACPARRAAFGARGVGLRLDLPPHPVWVIADPGRLEMAVENLLDNAAKHTPPGGRVTVAVSADGRDAVVCVRDTGAGIDPAVLPRVFEPFVRDDAVGPPGGAGLGLLLVRTLVELHGGRATAHSSGPGAGAEFVLRLPRLVEV